MSWWLAFSRGGSLEQISPRISRNDWERPNVSSIFSELIRFGVSPSPLPSVSLSRDSRVRCSKRGMLRLETFIIQKIKLREVEDPLSDVIASNSISSVCAGSWPDDVDGAVRVARDADCFVTPTSILSAMFLGGLALLCCTCRGFAWRLEVHSAFARRQRWQISSYSLEHRSLSR